MSCSAGRPASAPVGARWGFPARPAAPVIGEALRFGPENGFSSRNRSRVPGNPGTSPSEPGGSHPAAAIAGRILSVRPQAFTPGSARIPNYKLSTKTGQAQCATCGAREDEPDPRYGGAPVKLQRGHKDPDGPADDLQNILPQCGPCNQAYRRDFVFDSRGRVHAVADIRPVKRAGAHVRRKIRNFLNKQKL